MIKERELTEEDKLTVERIIKQIKNMCSIYSTNKVDDLNKASLIQVVDNLIKDKIGQDYGVMSTSSNASFIECTVRLPKWLGLIIH